MPRAFPLTLAFALLATVPTLATGHDVRHCEPERPFPSAAGWNVVPGRTLSYWLAPGYYAAILALDEVEVTLYEEPSCTLDPACHLHAVSGYITCWASGAFATIEVHNAGPNDVLVFGAIGRCHEPGAPC